MQHSRDCQCLSQLENLNKINRSTKQGMGQLKEVLHLNSYHKIFSVLCSSTTTQGTGEVNFV